MTPGCWEALGSYTLAEEGGYASLCGQLPGVSWTSRLQLGAAAPETTPKAPLSIPNPTSLTP